MPNTPMQGFPYPALSDAANGPVAFQNLAQAIEKRVVQIHADAAARTAAVSAPTAGMFSFLTSTGRFEYYTGTAWVALLPLTASVFTQTVAGAGNFIKPTGPPARIHIVELWGPGGAGGGVSGTGGQSEGSGGGSGAYVKYIYADSDLAASEPFVVGAGGAGVSGGNGGAGSAATTFKALSAGAGSGGLNMPAGATDDLRIGGAGGVAAGGHVNCRGGDGGHARRHGSFSLFTNFGAACPNGGGTTMQRSAVNSAGNAGAAPGGGGSGAFAATGPFAGGAGAVGKILITSIY